MKLTNQYSGIGSYWERGNKNKIDIVAINEENQTMLISEVKINPNKISIEKLKKKAQKIVQKYPKYNFEFVGYSQEDIKIVKNN